MDAVNISDEHGGGDSSEIKWAEMRAMGGYLVGTVDIIDCVSESESPWFCGKYGFVLANPHAFSVPMPCTGALGFFDVDAVKLTPKSNTTQV